MGNERQFVVIVHYYHMYVLHIYVMVKVYQSFGLYANKKSGL